MSVIARHNKSIRRKRVGRTIAAICLVIAPALILMLVAVWRTVQSIASQKVDQPLISKLACVCRELTLNADGARMPRKQGSPTLDPQDLMKSPLQTAMEHIPTPSLAPERYGKMLVKRPWVVLDMDGELIHSREPAGHREQPLSAFMKTVRTVICYCVEDIPYGRYRHGSTTVSFAYQRRLNVWVVDWPSEKVLAKASELGSPPPAVKSGDEAGYGSTPDIDAYLPIVLQSTK